MKKKNRQKLKLVILVIWPLALLLAGAIIMRPAKGFHPLKVKADKSFIKEIPQNEEQGDAPGFPTHILSQKFFYLASGADSYAFVSEDGMYVLKFFKMNHLRPKYWLSHIPLPILESYRFKKIEVRKRRRQEIIANFSSAFEDLKEETALVYLYLGNKHPSHEQITVWDKQGRAFKISLKEVPFILQRRAALIYPYVDSILASEGEGKAIGALLSILTLIKQRCAKGYVDLDPGISSNFGFVGGRPVQIDIGRLVKDDAIVETGATLREVRRVGKKLSLWVRQNHPGLAASFEKELEKFIQ